MYVFNIGATDSDFWCHASGFREISFPLIINNIQYIKKYLFVLYYYALYECKTTITVLSMKRKIFSSSYLLNAQDTSRVMLMGVQYCANVHNLEFYQPSLIIMSLITIMNTFYDCPIGCGTFHLDISCQSNVLMRLNF